MTTNINIDHLAKLARIDLSDKEKETFLNQLQDIVAYCSKIVAAKVDDLEPMVHSFEQNGNFWFEDAEDTEMPKTRDYILLNAPESKENQIVVPKVL